MYKYQYIFTHATKYKKNGNAKQRLDRKLFHAQLFISLTWVLLHYMDRNRKMYVAATPDAQSYDISPKLFYNLSNPS